VQCGVALGARPSHNTPNAPRGLQQHIFRHRACSNFCFFVVFKKYFNMQTCLPSQTIHRGIMCWSATFAAKTCAEKKKKKEKVCSAAFDALRKRLEFCTVSVVN
jgi:hypothetical protein